MSQSVRITVKPRYKDQDLQVSAKLVGGEDGVFAVWMEGEIVHMAAGDDGHWWEIGAYHKYWIPQIQKVLTEVVR